MYTFQLVNFPTITLPLALIQPIILLDLGNLLSQVRNLLIQPFQILYQLLSVLFLLVEYLVGLLLFGEGNVGERFGRVVCELLVLGEGVDVLLVGWGHEGGFGLEGVAEGCARGLG
jgi:hypothetical protein